MIKPGSWVAIQSRPDGPFRVLDIQRGWLKASRLDHAEISAKLTQASITDAPAKHDCNSPIWRWLSGKEWPSLGDTQQWVCLNCPLYQAIAIDRDRAEQQRLLALIDETRERQVRR